jgi:hypothetical protein
VPHLFCGTETGGGHRLRVVQQTRIGKHARQVHAVEDGAVEKRARRVLLRIVEFDAALEVFARAG